jgi:FMN phosphatase YigB (HAD superfamily)
VVRAVVFDLWQTLAAWPDDESHDLRRRWSDRLGITVEQLDEHWYGDERYRERRRDRSRTPSEPCTIRSARTSTSERCSSGGSS